MRPCKVETCVQNASLGSRTVAQRLAAEFPDLTVRHWACLGPCEVCVHTPFLLVNNTNYIMADHADSLHERVRAVLEMARASEMP